MRMAIAIWYCSLCLAPKLLTAQHTFNSTGNSLKTGPVSYAYSVGEVTGFQLNEHCIYTPGVIQPTKITVNTPEQKLFDNYHKALVYPNPTTGVVIIETNDPGITEYTVTSYDGKIVQTGKFNYLSINIQRLQTGLYLITLFTADRERRQTYKIMKL